MAEVQDKKSASIAAQKNGPLKVAGGVSLRNSRNEEVATKGTYYLCRCGWSKNLPFCDNTHIGRGFSDKLDPAREPDKAETYKGKQLSIRDNRGLCSHAGVCTTRLPQVWGATDPWINPDKATAKKITEVVRACPSGALATIVAGKEAAAVPRGTRPEIHIARNGPYNVRGPVALEGAKPLQGGDPQRYALCRCGASLNKPFCDGSHWYADFTDAEGKTISAAARRASGTGSEEWVVAARSTAVKEGQPLAVSLGARAVVLVRSNGKIYALDDKCPHQGGPLHEGKVCDGALRCPWHGYRFDLRTGRNAEGEAGADVFKVRESGGNVEILSPAKRRSAWTVSHVMMETLVEWGVDVVFGMVGHSNLGVADAVRIQTERGRMRYFGVRHEGAAAFAASGYAKVTGRPAACLAIAGPGATNLLTGLWDARMDRVPIIALTGQVNTQFLGPGAFQEVDLASAFAPVAAFSQTVLPDSDHAALAALACKNAIVRRDVAHLIFPDEVQTLDAGSAGPQSPAGRLSDTRISPPAQSVLLAGYRIARARHPLIIVGKGAEAGMEDVLALADRLGCPIATTFKAKGLIADAHPLAAGVLGRSGTPIASTLMNEADLLIVFGASFAQHTGLDPRKATIQVDFDRMTLGKFHPVAEPVWGDVGLSARAFQESLPKSLACRSSKPALKRLWSDWRKEKARRAASTEYKGVNAPTLFGALGKATPKGAVVAVDVGNNAYSFGRFFECREGQSVLMSGYLGSIGFGFPAAMGAWAAVGDKRKIVAVAGDGGFGQYLADFTTAVRYGMNITLVLIHNRELGKISKEQRDAEFPVWETELLNPNFARYAKLCGGEGVRVERADALEAALARAMKTKDGPFLLEVMTDAASW